MNKSFIFEIKAKGNGKSKTFPGRIAIDKASAIIDFLKENPEYSNKIECKFIR